MIAVGIALIGLATQSVYNAILSWTGSFLTISFILAIIFMFIMFLNHLKKNNYEMSTEMRHAQKDSLSAKKDLRHMQHDFKLDEKEREKVMNDLGDLSDKLDSMKRLSGTEIQMIDKLAGLLRKATAAASNNDQSGAHGYTQMLSKEIGTLITTMKHEDVDENALDKILMAIDGALDRWGHHADLEKDEEKHLNVIFNKVSSRVASAGADVAKRMVKDLMANSEKNLLHLLQEVRSKLIHLTQLKDAVMKGAEELRSSSYRAKHMEAQAVRTAIFNMQFTEAHNHLDQLRSLVEHEPSIISRVKAFETQMTQETEKLHSLQAELDQLLVGELGRVKMLLVDEKVEAKAKKKTYADTSDDIFGSARRIAMSVHKLMDSLKYILSERMVIPGPRGGETLRDRDDIKSAFGLLEGEHGHLMELARQDGKTDLDLKKEMVHFKELLNRLDHVANSVADTLNHFGGAPDAVTASKELIHQIERVKIKLNADIARASSDSSSPLSLS